MNIAFFPAHPAQFWMMKALYENSPKHIKITWYIRDKDVTQHLIESYQIPYTLVSVAKKGLCGNAIELFLNIFKFLYYLKKDKINLSLSKYGAINIASKILGIKSISFNDDDEDIVPLIALTSFPFVSKILCTQWTRMKRFEYKSVRYKSYHELFYLHPKRFTPHNKEAIKNLNKNSSYCFIRLSSLNAHHDVNAAGIKNDTLKFLLEKLSSNYEVVISAEGTLPEKYNKYKLTVEPSEVHHVLANASLIISDSQTMTAEGAILGIPTLRISSFKGKIGYLNELERAGLCSSVLHTEPLSKISNQIDKLLSIEPQQNITTKNNYLNELIDPVEFFWNEIEKTLYKSKL